MQRKLSGLGEVLKLDIIDYFQEQEVRDTHDRIIADTGREPIYKLFEKKCGTELRVYAYDKTCWKYVLLYVHKSRG